MMQVSQLDIVLSFHRFLFFYCTIGTLLFIHKCLFVELRHRMIKSHLFLVRNCLLSEFDSIVGLKLIFALFTLQIFTSCTIGTDRNEKRSNFTHQLEFLKSEIGIPIERNFPARFRHIQCCTIVFTAYDTSVFAVHFLTVHFIAVHCFAMPFLSDVFFFANLKDIQFQNQPFFKNKTK